MKSQKNKTRRGQVLVIFAVGMLPLMVALLTMVVDVGHVIVTRVQLQNAADAATLAATQVLLEQRSGGASEQQARQAATQEAQLLSNDNETDNATLSVEFGKYVDGQFVAVGTGEQATAVRGSLQRNADAPGGSVELVFCRIVGLNSVDADGAAGCQLADRVTGLSSGLSPFAIHENDIKDIGETLIMYPAGGTSAGQSDSGDGDDSGGGKGKGKGKNKNKNNDGGGGLGQSQTGPGNWGLLDLDGGSNPTGDLARWIRYGYEGKIELASEGFLLVDGNPGFRAALKDDVQWRIDNAPDIIVCVYNGAEGGGNNLQYKIVGFLSVTLLEVRLTGNNKYIKCRSNGLTALPEAIVDPGGDSSLNVRKIQLAE